MRIQAVKPSPPKQKPNRPILGCTSEPRYVRIHSMRQTPPKRVAVAFQLAGEPGRRKLRGFLRYIAEHGLDWQLHFVRRREDFSAQFVASFRERGIDGLVYSAPTDRACSAELARLDIPTVAVEIYDEATLGGRRRNLVLITGSPEDTARCAAQHFLSQGIYRSYGFVPDLGGSIWGCRRGAAFADAMRANGFRVARYRTRGTGYDLPHLAAWIAQRPKPAAVFAALDDRAIQVLEACREAGAAVPRDVAVIGVDNDEMLCTHTTPPLTSIQTDHELMGARAAEWLARMMDGKRLTKPEHCCIREKTIVVRESTSPVSPSGRLVQRAIAFILNNATRAIRSKDVAAYLNVSRSLADLRFRELQGESIGDAIRRARLEAVRTRLQLSTDTIDNIALACGFTRLSRLNAAFRKAYGKSLQDYRTIRSVAADKPAASAQH